MSNFLRGGQVTTHKFRMMVQVIRIILRITFFAIAITIFLTFKNNIESYQWKMVPSILSKYIFQDLNPEKVVKYQNKLGITLKDKVRHLSINKDFIYVEQQFFYVLMLSLKRLIWVVTCSISIAMLYFWFRGKALQENKEIRGSFLVEEQKLKALVTKHNKQFNGINPYTLAGIPYAAMGKKKAYTPGEQAHTLIIGATGSGKTKIIQNLVQQINERNSKAIIIDIKGDYIKYFYNKARGDVILNPIDERGANWSFFVETDSLKGFDTIANTLIPDVYGDPFWTNSARILFSELASLYTNSNLSIAQFSKEILEAKLGHLEKLLANTRAHHLINQKAEKTVICVLMMLSIYLAPFKLYNTNKDLFSISKWVKDSSLNNFLFIATSPDVKGSLNPLVQMQVDLAINALCSSKNEGNEQIWFILDELAYFDRGLPNLKDGLTTSRSFGGGFVLGVQDLSSLSKVYGNDLSRVIANNCRNKFVMNVDDSYTAKWCSDLFGEGEIEEWQEGLSYGAHEMRDGVSSNKNSRIKRTILPSQFSQLATGSGYIKLPAFHPSLIKFKDFYVEGKNSSFIENKELRKMLEKELQENQINKVKLDEAMKKAKGSVENTMDSDGNESIKVRAKIKKSEFQNSQRENDVYI